MMTVYFQVVQVPKVIQTSCYT